ncbi:MAG: hypothetical protein HDS72_02410 [Bacteroidales bacterium]|nr:hypothetical protein [Bacteroidales bacterium]
MKSIYHLLLSIFVLLVPLTLSADENPPQPLPIKKSKPEIPPQHKAPSLIRLYFTYSPQEKCATFELLSDIEYIDIEAENLESHIIYVGSVWAENSVWNQELPTGEYIITCTADNGDVYEGYIYI